MNDAQFPHSFLSSIMHLFLDLHHQTRLLLHHPRRPQNPLIIPHLPNHLNPHRMMPIVTQAAITPTSIPALASHHPLLLITPPHPHRHIHSGQTRQTRRNGQHVIGKGPDAALQTLRFVQGWGLSGGGGCDEDVDFGGFFVVFWLG